MTLRDRILWYVLEHPHQSASQIAHGVQFHVSSVHETLRRLAKRNIVRRHHDGRGPRGGSTWTFIPAVPDKFDRPVKIF